MKRIVVLGAGYGGTYVFKHLHRRFHGTGEAELLLINKTNYFISTPFLHEVATGNLSPEHIVEPLRKVLNCTHEQFLQSEVESVSLEKREVLTHDGVISYDYLVLATGAETNFRGVPGAAEQGWQLKTLEHAIALKNRFIEMFEQAAAILGAHVRSPADAPSIAELLHFVVVGGGATGVELAAEMADLFYQTFAAYYDERLIGWAKITLVHAGDELLANFQESIRVRSKRVLRNKKVELRFGLSVSEVSPDGLCLTNGEKIKARTIIWVAGVRPALPVFDIKLGLEAGRITVNQYLQLPNYPEVFALGDLAAFRNPDSPGPLPMLAQVAHRQAQGVARNVIRLVEGRSVLNYTYKHQGDLVSLGDWIAAGELFGIRLFGHLTWFIWRGVYLAKLISPAKKAKVLLDWIVDLFSPRDIAQLYQCDKKS